MLGVLAVVSQPVSIYSMEPQRASLDAFERRTTALYVRRGEPPSTQVVFERRKTSVYARRGACYR